MNNITRVKVCTYDSSSNSISLLRVVACHMGSHRVIFHPTQVNTPRLPASPIARHANTRFTYLGEKED